MIADEVREELDKLGVTSVSPGLSAVALKLAAALDALGADDAPTSQAVVADKLTAVLAKLRTLAPSDVKGDALDDLADRRAKRRGA
ncbi:hypothetical protein [Streptomyces sp. NPDC088270]|uniref:hypothetical protein n=1 Tax=unclassified Streptomyces TaxID=2593676 RepID=UPI0034408CF3